MFFFSRCAFRFLVTYAKYALVALSYGSLTTTKYLRFRGIESVRQNVGFAPYRPNETVYIRQANKTVCRYCLQADYGFDSLDKIPTLPRYRKRKAKGWKYWRRAFAGDLENEKQKPLSIIFEGGFFILSFTRFVLIG